MKKKVSSYRDREWLKPIDRNRYLLIVILTVTVTMLLSKLPAVGQPVAYSPMQKSANEVWIVAQEETKAPPSEEKPQTETEASEQQELPQKQEESAKEAESLQEGEAPSGEESPQEGEAPSGEESPQEQEVSLPKAKESLEEEINEKYEEWEALRISSEIWHSVSAIATILITLAITLLGAGLFELPYKKLVIFILGAIAVLIQLNVNIFLLEKSIGGYKILEEHGSFLRSRVESVRTDEQLSELREEFQALVLEAEKFE